MIHTGRSGCTVHIMCPCSLSVSIIVPSCCLCLWFYPKPNKALSAQLSCIWMLLWANYELGLPHLWIFVVISGIWQQDDIMRAAGTVFCCILMYCVVWSWEAMGHMICWWLLGINTPPLWFHQQNLAEQTMQCIVTIVCLLSHFMQKTTIRYTYLAHDPCAQSNFQIISHWFRDKLWYYSCIPILTTH